jgi:hypothetical protein
MKALLNICIKKYQIPFKPLVFTFFGLFFFILQVSAQLGDPGGGGGGGDPDVPIDGGLSLLVAAGVGYGAKQLRKKKTSKQL